MKEKYLLGKKRRLKINHHRRAGRVLPGDRIGRWRFGFNDSGQYLAQAVGKGELRSRCPVQIERIRQGVGNLPNRRTGPLQLEDGIGPIVMNEAGGFVDVRLRSGRDFCQ